MQTDLLRLHCQPQASSVRPRNTLTNTTLIGTYAPRQCGIATFTQDLRSALIAANPSLKASVAMLAEESCSLHPPEVRHVVCEQNRADYAALRHELNHGCTQTVSLQHEYGIFGGPDGAWILDTLRGLRAPVVTTCHTLLATPSPGQHQVLCEIARLSARLVVMAQRGRELLTTVYGVRDSKIAVIPHGIPDTDPTTLDREALRRELGWTGHKVLLTTGLLSPNKGLQHAIAALPKIAAAHPDALYVIAGATHPNLVRREGESFRESLIELAASLGVADHVCFLNRFASREDLVRTIIAADLFVTPYLSEAQITSGVLAYASGLGKPVISTPYWHARELLDETSGVLVPFASPDAIAEAAISLLGDEPRLRQMSQNARAKGEKSTWQRTGAQYLQVLEEAGSRAGLAYTRRSLEHQSEIQPDPIALNHLHRLTGPLGIYQHALLTQPNLEHGYCTDDNARALILAQDLHRTGHPYRELREIHWRSFAFLCAAFDAKSGRFRNFRSTEGQWLDSPGSEDSHGRAIWALGHTSAHAIDPSMISDTTRLLSRALKAVVAFTSPRAWAFTLLGLAAFRAAGHASAAEREIQSHLAKKLLQVHQASVDRNWRWFEDALSYDNARLSQALLLTASQTGDRAMRAVGLNSLAWLMQWQRAPEGHFRAIGSDGFFHRSEQEPAQWDQQPVEALASCAACLDAHRVGGDRNWLTLAHQAGEWFDGANDLGLPVGNFLTGACFDGLHRDRLNQNCGAESTLAFLQTRTSLRLANSALASGSERLRIRISPINPITGGSASIISP